MISGATTLYKAEGSEHLSDKENPLREIRSKDKLGKEGKEGKVGASKSLVVNDYEGSDDGFL